MLRPPQEKMNGTRNWCTLVDVHPEGQAAVSKSVRAAYLAWYSRFRILHFQCPARSLLTSPDAALGVVSSSRRFSFFYHFAAGSGVSRIKTLLRLQDTGLPCPLGGHCGSCPGLGAGRRCALLRVLWAVRLCRRRMSSRDGIPVLFWTLVPIEGD